MLTERQQQFAALIRKEKSVSVRRLSKKFFVSEMTVRRDLTELEKQGYVKRYRGGACACAEDTLLPVDARKRLRAEEKQRLSCLAKKYLEDSATVYLDSSSTCMYMIPILAEYKDIRIVTNSVQSLLLAAQYHIPCMLAGGEYYERDMCTVGSVAEDFLRNVNADIAFFSSHGISDDGVISDDHLGQTAIRRTVMQNAKKIIFLFDSSKVHKKYVYTLCTRDAADDIIVI